MSDYRQFSKFLVVGALSAVVNFGSFEIAFEYIQCNYQIAATIAYVLSVIAHFIGHRYYTFKSKEQNFLPQLKKYLAMLSTNYLLSLGVITFCVELLGLSPLLGLACAIITTVGIGYQLSRKWVFAAS